jgi:uncharacterized membrane protein
VVLVAVAYAAPFLHQQFLTGSLVNATLFIAVALLGNQAAIMVGLIPSVIALSVGTLPAPLAPMVPYIMVSNSLLVLVFGLLKEKYWTAVLLCSVLKFGFLYLTSFIVTGLLLKIELAQGVSTMLSWPQLVTALTGGALAFIFLRIYSGKQL